MRKIRIFAHISLDGVISPGGLDDDSDYANGGWTAQFRTPAGAAAVAELYGTRFDLLLGRRTYDQWAAYWPRAGKGPIADGLNTATKYVATHRPDSLPWGPVKELGPDIVESIRNLKSAGGPDLIVCGSTTLTPLLFNQQLVDDVVLMVYPVLLGRGKRFFSDTVAASELGIISSMSTVTGVLINSYRHIGPLRPS